MEIIKIIGIGIISLIVLIIVKQYKPEFSAIISIVAGIIIFSLVFDRITGIINILKSLTNKIGINSTYISILLKITGIAILTEFAVSVCKDAGETAIASKIDFGGKIIIISIAIPIITALLEIIVQVMP